MSNGRYVYGSAGSISLICVKCGTQHFRNPVVALREGYKEQCVACEGDLARELHAAPYQAFLAKLAVLCHEYHITIANPITLLEPPDGKSVRGIHAVAAQGEIVDRTISTRNE